MSFANTLVRDPSAPLTLTNSNYSIFTILFIFGFGVLVGFWVVWF
jgi:hypothetical protein